MPSSSSSTKFAKTLKRVKITRKGTKIKIGVGDFVHVESEDSDVPFVARIIELGQNSRGDSLAEMQWMYRQSDVRNKPSTCKKNEIFFSVHQDRNPVDSIIEPVRVKFVDSTGDTFTSQMYDESEMTNKQFGLADYVCFQEYDMVTHKLAKLSKDRLDSLKSMVTAARCKTRDASPAKSNNGSAIGVSPSKASGAGKRETEPSVVDFAKKRKLELDDEADDDTDRGSAPSTSGSTAKLMDVVKQQPAVKTVAAVPPPLLVTASKPVPLSSPTTPISATSKKNQELVALLKATAADDEDGDDRPKALQEEDDDVTYFTASSIPLAAAATPSRLLARTPTGGEIPKMNLSKLTEDERAFSPAAAPRRRRSTRTSEQTLLDEWERQSRLPSLEHPKGSVRIGMDYQTTIPLYLGKKPVEPTANDEILWSPRVVTVSPGALDPSFTEKLNDRGSAVPVAIIEPHAKALADRKRVMWARVAEAIGQQEEVTHLRGVPFDVVWPTNVSKPSSFLVQAKNSMFDIPRKAVIQPENYQEQYLVNAYRLAMHKDPIKISGGLDEILESWTEKEYNEFCLGVRALKPKDQLSKIANAIKSKTTAEVVEMYWVPARSGTESAPSGVASCSVCGNDRRAVLACRRLFDCKSSVCSTCFKDAKVSAKLVDGDRDENAAMDAFEQARFGHWFCKTCNKRFQEEERGRAKPLQNAAARAPSPTFPTTYMESPRPNLPSSTALPMQQQSKATLTSAVSLTALNSKQLSTVTDVLMAFDDEKLTAEEALSVIRNLMIFEAEKAMKLKNRM